MSSRRAGRSFRTAWRLTLVVLGLALVACGGDTARPTGDAWRLVWDAERALVDDISADIAAGEERCNELVGELRASRDSLLPTPNAVLDESVESWLGLAEGLVFDCPSDGEVVAERAHDLDVLRAEIDAGLAADQQNP